MVCSGFDIIWGLDVEAIPKPWKSIELGRLIR